MASHQMWMQRLSRAVEKVFKHSCKLLPLSSLCRMSMKTDFESTESTVSPDRGASVRIPPVPRYRSCDVNAYLRAELPKVLAGDVYRADCHFVPQAEYFENPFANTTAIDNRGLPQKFNDLMVERGYFNISMPSNTLHNYVCNNISAYTLAEDVKALIRQVYARDFDLICNLFGYCDREEVTCLQQVPNMCGGKPGTNASAFSADAGQDVRSSLFPKWPCGKPGE
eukprot:g16941.t1